MDGTVVKIDEDDDIVAFVPGKKFKYSDIDEYYKTVNIYKFSKTFSRTHYVPFLEAYVKALGNNEYYEQVLRVIMHLDDSELKAKRLSGQLWYEIDDLQDLDIAESMFMPDDDEQLYRFEARYGPLEKWEESDCNPRFLAKSLLDSGAELPKLYIACGWNDRLCVTNREYHHYLEEIGFPHVYEEGPGSHEWATWRWALPRALDFCSWLGPDTFENPFYCEMRDERYVGAPWKEEG